MVIFSDTIESISHNISNISRLNGRENRSSYAPFAIIINFIFIILNLGINQFNFGLFARSIFTVRLSSYVGFSVGGIQQRLIDSTNAQINLSHLSFIVLTIFWFISGGAATVRRLHDTGTSGVILIFYFILIIYIPSSAYIFNQFFYMNSDYLNILQFTRFFAIATSSIFSIFLLIQLAKQGNCHHNRYGLVHDGELVFQ